LNFGERSRNFLGLAWNNNSSSIRFGDITLTQKTFVLVARHFTYSREY